MKDLTETMLPGTVRVSITIYDSSKSRSYRSLSGFSISGLKVRNRRELNRLWKRIERDTRAGWRDDEQSARNDRGPVDSAAGR